MNAPSLRPATRVVLAILGGAFAVLFVAALVCVLPAARQLLGIRTRDGVAKGGVRERLAAGPAEVA